jgi:hypothetical protein
MRTLSSWFHRVPRAARASFVVGALGFAVVGFTHAPVSRASVAGPDASRPAALSPLAGSWTLVAADRIGTDGVRRSDYGPHPHGRMIVGEDGRYATQIYSEERVRFAAGDKSKATLAELSSAVVGMSAHFGTLDVDVAAAAITFHIAWSAFPNWEGTAQRRQYVLHDGELTYQVPASASGNGTIAISVWRRDP